MRNTKIKAKKNHIFEDYIIQSQNITHFLDFQYLFLSCLYLFYRKAFLFDFHALRTRESFAIGNSIQRETT